MTTSGGYDAAQNPLSADVTSWGGGRQSMALMVMAAQGEFDCRDFVMANVGDDSENPGTLRYLRDHALPFAEAHGLNLHVLDKQRRGGGTETLLEQIRRVERSIPFPMRMPDNGAPGNRSCTATFKIRVVARWTKAQGFTADRPARVAVGISADEFWRANSRQKVAHEVPVYPLMEHDPPLTRRDCERIVRAAGLPVPPKSSCWFCPMHTPDDWLRMRQDEPDLFAKSVALEAEMIDRRVSLGRDPLYMTRLGAPLDQVIPEGAVTLPFLMDDSANGCDSSSCFT